MAAAFFVHNTTPVTKPRSRRSTPSQASPRKAKWNRAYEFNIHSGQKIVRQMQKKRSHPPTPASAGAVRGASGGGGCTPVEAGAAAARLGEGAGCQGALVSRPHTEHIPRPSGI